MLLALEYMLGQQVESHFGGIVSLSFEVFSTSLKGLCVCRCSFSSCSVRPVADFILKTVYLELRRLMMLKWLKCDLTGQVRLYSIQLKEHQEGQHLKNNSVTVVSSYSCIFCCKNAELFPALSSVD